MMIPVGTISQQSAVQQPLLLGINGQFMQHAAYNTGLNGISYPQQVVFATQMGAPRYRTTVTAGVDGTLSTERYNQMFDAGGNQANRGMVQQLQAAGIELLPVINDRLYEGDPLYTSSNQERYDAGYALGNGFVTNYGSLLSGNVYELGNEIELFRNGTIQSPGDTPDDYAANFLDTVAHYVSGMNDGIKDADPLAKTIFNTSGFWKLALWDTVFGTALTYTHDIDYCGCHWYQHSAGGLDGLMGERWPTDFLYSRYGKPIAYTEFGLAYVAGNGKTTNHNNDVTFFDEAWAHMQANKDKIVIAHRHEMLDRVNSDGSYNSEEQNYGLVWFPDFANTGFANPALKPLGIQLGLSL